MSADPGEGPFDDQRFGKTTNRCASERLTISSAQWPVAATVRVALAP
jgi:hypothetical protein